MREALKENGIGRPSTRAAIIETLFKRRYIRKERKNLIATPTGVELIELIQVEMLKSAELTGVWEKKLREIEKQKYDARLFLAELKQMVTDIIYDVRQDTTNRQVPVTTEDDFKKKSNKRKKADIVSQDKSRTVAGFQPRSVKNKTTLSVGVKGNNVTDEWIGLPCPLCHAGKIVKGRTAYGCSRWNEGCTFRRPLDDFNLADLND